MFQSVFTKLGLVLIAFVALSNIYSTFVEARTSPQLKVPLSHGGILVGRHLTSHHGRSIRAFLGVPYAVAPVGDLRFRAPVPFGSWVGERKAVADSGVCTQFDVIQNNIQVQGSEDCLYLNVYVPAKPIFNVSLPVMVWFHGGAFAKGTGMSSFYAPNYILDRDIILVSANYRLGTLGFLSTETSDCPGNYGIKDQVEVLNWIQKNIAAFGGNPKSVTIFGESSGGSTVSYLMLSEKAKGLFHKAISQSGTYFNPWAQTPKKGASAEKALKVAGYLGCSNSSSDFSIVMACLRTKSAGDIASTLNNFIVWGKEPVVVFPPVVEPASAEAVITAFPSNTTKPHGNSIPLMIGVNSDEGLFRSAGFVNQPSVLEDFKTNFDKILPVMLYYDQYTPEVQQNITSKLMNFYFKDGLNFNKTNYQNITDLITDSYFLHGIDEYIRNRVADKTSSPTYVYLFQHKGASSMTEFLYGGEEDFYGTCHLDDLLYLFPIASTLFVTAAPTDRDIIVREGMLNMWVNFATTSNPTPPGHSFNVWSPTTSYPISYLRIGSKNESYAEPLFKQDNGLLQDRVDFWKNLNLYS